ncbi:MAG: hypothetical protein GY749_15775 [Desulfobacteraceae bacterium]|nr:hypothetical protein [Desulfobacteraceae bacterium]
MNTHTLKIRHVSADPDRFEVMHLKDGKSTPAAEIRSPDLLKVEGRPDTATSTVRHSPMDSWESFQDSEKTTRLQASGLSDVSAILQKPMIRQKCKNISEILSPHTKHPHPNP